MIRKLILASVLLLVLTVGHMDSFGEEPGESTKLSNENASGSMTTNNDVDNFEASDFVNVVFGDVKNCNILGIKRGDSFMRLIDKFDLEVTVIPDESDPPNSLKFYHRFAGNNDIAIVIVELEFDGPVKQFGKASPDFMGVVREQKANPKIEKVSMHIDVNGAGRQAKIRRDEIVSAIKRSFDIAGFNMEQYHSMGSSSETDYRHRNEKNNMEVTIGVEDGPLSGLKVYPIFVYYQFGADTEKDIDPRIEKKEASLENIKTTLDVKIIPQFYDGYADAATLTIFRNGERYQTEEITLGEAYTAWADVEIEKLSVSDEPIIVFKSHTRGAHVHGSYVIYYYDKTANKYLSKAVTEFEIITIDNDGNKALNFPNSFLADGYGMVDIIDLPLIVVLKNGVFFNVTRKYPNVINANAERFLKEYRTGKCKSDRDLYGYMICKYLVGEKAIALQTFDKYYKNKDKAARRKNITKEINAFLPRYKNDINQIINQ